MFYYSIEGFKTSQILGSWTYYNNTDFNNLCDMLFYRIGDCRDEDERLLKLTMLLVDFYDFTCITFDGFYMSNNYKKGDGGIGCKEII